MQNYETEAANFPHPTYNQDSIEIPQLHSPDNPPWNWGMGIVVWLASVGFLFAAQIIAVMGYIASSRVSVTDPKQLSEIVQNDPNAILVSILSVIPAHLLTLAVAWAVMTRLNKFSFAEMIGWRWGGFKFWHLVVILVGFFALAYLLTMIFGDQDNELLRILRSSRTVVYAVAFMATFTAPAVEEIVYRGALYSSFRKRFGNSKAVILATLLFALVHVPQYYPNAATIISICVLSLVLTLVRAKTKNLLPCIVLHTVFNGIQSAGLILEPYLRNVNEQTNASAAFIIHLFK